MNNVEKKLREACAKNLIDARKKAAKARADARKYLQLEVSEAKKVFELRAVAEKLHAAEIDFSASGRWLFIHANSSSRDKAGFSALVKRVANAIGEQPDITVEHGAYVADFKQSNVYFSLWGATDCQLIETEETVVKKVLKPHPRCLAALKELEEAG